MNRPIFPAFWTHRCSAILAFVAACFLTAAPVWAQGDATLNIQKDAYPVKESARSVSITVVRTGNTNLGASVGFQTVDQNAIAGADYVGTNVTLDFPPGVRQMSLSVVILQDFTDEVNEVFTVELIDPVIGATIGSQFNATVTIQDDETCGYSLAAAARTHGWSAASSNLIVRATNGCFWRATIQEGRLHEPGVLM